jgi:hypothetical protein
MEALKRPQGQAYDHLIKTSSRKSFCIPFICSEASPPKLMDGSRVIKSKRIEQSKKDDNLPIAHLQRGVAEGWPMALPLDREMGCPV